MIPPIVKHYTRVVFIGWHVVVACGLRNSSLVYIFCIAKHSNVTYNFVTSYSEKQDSEVLMKYYEELKLSHYIIITIKK